MSRPQTALTPLTEAQVGQLLVAINKVRVVTRDGQNYIEAYDARAHLNRIFGFGGWSGDVLEESLLYEDLHESEAKIVRGQRDPNHVPKPVVSVGYRVRYRLTVWVWLETAEGTLQRHELATYTEVATGSASNFPQVKRADAHDFAVKTAESQAFKRTLINLGDQFGLALYNAKAYRANPEKPLVKSTLVGWPPKQEGAPKPTDVQDGVDPVAAENNSTAEVPEAERAWIDQAEALDGDPDALEALWSEARAAKNPKASPELLAALRSMAERARGEGDAP